MNVFLSTIKKLYKTMFTKLDELQKKVKKDFENNGLKEVHYIDDKESIPKKVLNCEVLHYNYIIVLGKKELANNSINVRGIGEIKLDDFTRTLSI